MRRAWANTSRTAASAAVIETPVDPYTERRTVVLLNVYVCPGINHVRDWATSAAGEVVDDRSDGHSGGRATPDNCVELEQPGLGLLPAQQSVHIELGERVGGEDGNEGASDH